MKINKSGSVRVDLLGGTLDIHPINLVLKNVITLNMATGLMANVEISTDNSSDSVTFISEDYQMTKSFKLIELKLIDEKKDIFGPFEFLSRILSLFNPSEGMIIKLSSGAPPGSGLGGSSAMGAVFFSACCEFFGKSFSSEETVRIVQNIESKILNAGPAGYQDYYPSLFGGILALKASSYGVEVEQLYHQDLAEFLGSNLRLIFSGESRDSGINNWEVYKAFFDGVKKVRSGLEQISDLSNLAYQAIRDKNFSELIDLISKEGELREDLFPTILTPKMKKFKSELRELAPNAGFKVCGAGGGGCFIISGVSGIDIDTLLSKYEMRELPFDINKPQ